MAERYMTSFMFEKGDKVQVDMEKGIIYGAAVVTPGEAKGHGVQLDAEFVDEIVKQGNALRNGAKSRYGHPTMSGTALGTFLGRAKNFRRDGDIARADLFLSNEAKDAPGGDLYTYVLNMANNNPDVFGLSIVFKPGKQYSRDENGDKDYENFNGKDLPFIECKQFTAVDFVDDPAANPDGLFSSAFNTATIAGQVSEFLDTHPQVWEVLCADPSIIEGFMGKYADYKERCFDAKKTNEDSVESDNQQTASVDVNTNEEFEMDKELIAKINEEFGSDILAQTMLNDGDYDYAKALHTENEQANIVQQLSDALVTVEMLEANVEELQAKLDALSVGEEASEFDEAPVVDEPKEPVNVVDEIKCRTDEGMSFVEAQDAVAREYPEEFNAFNQGVK